MNTLSSLHSLSDKSVSTVEQHSLLEAELRLTLRLHIHTLVIQPVELIAIFITSLILRRGLLEDILLRVQKDIEVNEVEPLINHLLNLLLSLGWQFTSVNPLAFLRIVVDLRTALVCVVL